MLSMKIDIVWDQWEMKCFAKQNDLFKRSAWAKKKNEKQQQLEK